MAFRISELTSAVNSYLNSISSAHNSGASIGSELKGIFQKYFSKAVSDVKVEVPNIREEIQANIDSHNYAPKEAAEVAANDYAGKPTDSSKAAAAAKADSAKSDYATNLASLITASKAGGNLDMATALETIMKASGKNTETSENADVYKGVLSDSALRDLSDSSYFYTNMIQSSLFKTSDDEENSGSSSSSNSLQGQSLDKLNENSLVNATLGTADSTYYQTLLQAYKTLPTESVFGDFLL